MEQKLIGWLRQATVADRVGLARSVTATTIRLARAAIDRAHPEWSQEERDLYFLEVHYGREVAERVRRLMARHPS